MDIGTTIGTYTIILCDSFKNDLNDLVIFLKPLFGRTLTIFEACKGT